MATITETKTAMLLHHPFFASLLLDMMKMEIGKFPERFPPGMVNTMATDGKTIWVDEDFLESLHLNEALFVVCHEIGHAMWRHMPRGKIYLDSGFDGRQFMPLLWNIAGDYVINDMLVSSNVGKMPKIALHDKKYPYTELVDDVYRKLFEENKCPQCGGSGEDDEEKEDDEGSGGSGEGEEGEDESEGSGSGKCNHDQEGKKPCPSCKGSGMKGGKGQTLDHHILEVGSDQANEAEWKRAVQSAKDAAKAIGKMPASLERFVDQLLEPKVPWEDLLRLAVSKKIGRDTTNWSRPHRRRLITQGVIMPTYKGYGAGHIVFCVDTSGSMSEAELSQALGECDKILVDCNPERVTLIGCDARVETVIELAQGDTLQNNIPRIGGGGGTSFIPPFEWVEEEGARPDTLVYFTDTGGVFPAQAPGYPVIWCCSQKWTEPPFGEIIHIDMERELCRR